MIDMFIKSGRMRNAMRLFDDRSYGIRSCWDSSNNDSALDEATFASFLNMQRLQGRRFWSWNLLIWVCHETSGLWLN